MSESSTGVNAGLVLCLVVMKLKGMKYVGNIWVEIRIRIVWQEGFLVPLILILPLQLSKKGEKSKEKLGGKIIILIFFLDEEASSSKTHNRILLYKVVLRSQNHRRTTSKVQIHLRKYINGTESQINELSGVRILSPYRKTKEKEVR